MVHIMHIRGIGSTPILYKNRKRTYQL